MFPNASSLKKIENLQKRVLRFLYNDYEISYLSDLYSFRETSRLEFEFEYMFNLNIPVDNHVTFGSKSLRIFGPKVCNSFPYHVKPSENLDLFKMIIKHWNGTRCDCKVCNTPLLLRLTQTGN